MLVQSTIDKPRYPRAQAIEVCREILQCMKPVCERIIIAGSLRRRKESVGDIEVLFIPKFKQLPKIQQDDFLAPPQPQQFDAGAAMVCALAGYYKEGGEVIRAKDYILTPRRTSTGSWTWGPKNKLARHIASGIPVDFFTATEANWFNLLVCRTGSADNNTRISTAALKINWKWHPYDPGFTDEEGNWVAVHSEQDVYRLARLPYLEPWQR